MASSSSKSIGQCRNIRSISLPARSHHSTLKIEEELNKLKTWETSATPSAETIYNGLCGLVELYECMDDLLNMPQTLQALFKHRNAKWVDELLEGPVKLLDICGITRDVMSQLNEHARDLQSSLRRRRGDLSIEASIHKYISFRKKMKKDTKSLIASLKQMDQTIEASILDFDQHLSAVIRVLREVNAMSVSIFHAVLIFLSASKSKPTRWSFSRLVHKGVVVCEGQQVNMNELEIVDDALSSLSKNCASEVEKIQFVQRKLNNLEACFEAIEARLEVMHRCLIRSRTCLLNIFSC